jgi:multicomponent Na+:H+ antiporter subunit C
MTSTRTIFSACAAVLVGIGAFGLFSHAHLLRRIVAFNVIGSGVFLMFGAMAARLPQAGADPVPQAMVITGIVVALAATALAVPCGAAVRGDRPGDLAGRGRGG